MALIQAQAPQPEARQQTWASNDAQPCTAGAACSILPGKATNNQQPCNIVNSYSQRLQRLQPQATNHFRPVPITLTMNLSGNVCTSDLFGRLISSRPVILGGSREPNTVFIKWTFPYDMQSSVSNYVILYHTSQSQTWKEAGLVAALPVPMSVTLSNGFGTLPCAFSIKATFINGTSSLASAPLTV